MFSIADNDWKFKTVKTKDVTNGPVTYHLVGIGTLAEAVGRSVACVLVWERQKKLPEPRFRLQLPEGSQTKQRRWYSLTQVVMIQDHLISLLNGKKPSSAKNTQFDFKTFFERVQADWAIDDASK